MTTKRKRLYCRGSDAERLAAWSEKNEGTGCIECGCGVGPNGYARIGQRYAHRVAWEIANGAIPPELQVLHRCDNRRCVNIDHLFLGTNGDNIADKLSKRRHSFGERVPAAKLTADQARAIYADPRGCRKLSREYGLSRSCIQDIRAGRSWREATGAST